MLYKPNYCCSCGEKIERAEWNLLTSRRFCPSCAIEKKRYDYALRGLTASGVLLLMFGIGSLWGAGSGDQQMVSAVATPVKAEDTSSQGAPANARPSEKTTVNYSEALPANLKVEESDKIRGNKAETSGTLKYYCGALTKKGTPCSRKVRNEGSRCFQHEGKPAAPPQN